MKVGRFTVASVVGIVSLCIFTAVAKAGDGVVTSEMAGDWVGDAGIIVKWCAQTNLHVSVTIQSDGSVSGEIGDATLVNGVFKQSRGWLGRKLRVKTDYVLVGKLSGPLIAAEGIERSRVSIPVNFADGVFSGGVHTSGLHFGGKKRMVLSATGLRLIRPPGKESIPEP